MTLTPSGKRHSYHIYNTFGFANNIDMQVTEKARLQLVAIWKMCCTMRKVN